MATLPLPPPAPEMADGRQGIAPRGPLGVWHALRWSLQGLRAAWTVESSFRLEVCLFVLLVGFVAFDSVRPTVAARSRWARIEKLQKNAAWDAEYGELGW